MESRSPATKFLVSHGSLLPDDYVSPNFHVVMPDICFPQMKRGNMDVISNPLFRKQIKHAWYVDPNFPECGFLTRDEASILFNNAIMFSGAPALEIGSHVGWYISIHSHPASQAFLTCVPGVKLDVVEPMLTHDPRVLIPLISSLRMAEVNNNVNLVAGFSPEEVHKLGEAHGRRWNFIFIDGNHNGDFPLRDAQVCATYAAQDCMILFHDLAFPEVAAGFAWLAHNGWNTRIYHTQQIMGVAWRGNVEPVTHHPDPNYSWELPEHLMGIPSM